MASDYVPSSDADMQRAGVRDSASLGVDPNETPLKRQQTTADRAISVAVNEEQRLREENARLVQRLRAVEQERDKLQAELQRSQERIGNLEHSMGQLQAEFAAGKQELAAMKESVTLLLQQRDGAISALKPTVKHVPKDSTEDTASQSSPAPTAKHRTYAKVAAEEGPAEAVKTKGPRKGPVGTQKGGNKGPNGTQRDPNRAPPRPQGRREQLSREQLADALMRLNNVILRGVKGCVLRDTNRVVRELLVDEGVDVPSGTRFIRLGVGAHADANKVYEGPVKALCSDPRAAVELTRQVERHFEGAVKVHADLSAQERADKAARRRMNDVWEDYKAKGYMLTWVDGTQLFCWKPGALEWAPVLPNPPAAAGTA
jgi:hypothetical protein